MERLILNLNTCLHKMERREMKAGKSETWAEERGRGGLRGKEKEEK